MNLGELAEFLVKIAKTYRNIVLVNEIVPKLNGQKINEETVRKIIGPYLELVETELSPDIMNRLRLQLKGFALSALVTMKRNSHMHDAGDSDMLTQKSADALLALFVNEACMPLDLALYASDLSQDKLPDDVKLKCTGPDLRGCPNGADAIYETNSNHTWKGGVHQVYVCEACARKLLE